MAINSIKRQNVGDFVLEEMKRAISSGEWKPGAKIPSENKLANEMGVSRISVHGAIQKLSSIGVLESRQGEGTFVCDLNGSYYMNAIIPVVMLNKVDVRYMLEFRDILECEGAALAARRGNEREFQELKGNFEKMKKADPFSQECSMLDVEFHFKIAEMTKNPMIIKVMQILKNVILDTMVEISTILKENNALYFHERILHAMENRDEKTASKIMKEHLERTMQSID